MVMVEFVHALILYFCFICSCFLTFDQNGFQVVVSTKSPKSDKQYVWEAVADSSSYVIREETDPEKLLRRGTQITLYLRAWNFQSLL